MKNLTILEQSVLGKVEPIQQGNQVLVPSTGFGTVVMNSRMPDLGRVKYKKAPKTLNEAIRLKSLNGVLPCKGITELLGAGPLRNPPPNPNNQQAPQGIARGQRKGLAYGADWEYHNISKNAPVLPRASSAFRGLDSILGVGTRQMTKAR